MYKKCTFIIVLSLVFISICNFVHAENDEINIYSPSAILIDQDSGRILYEKNIHEKMYPASLTKVLTAIIVLENCNLEEICTVSYDAVMKVGFGYVTANLQIGEELTVEQLLNLIMVSSSNDASHVLAEHVSGSLEDFAILMNKKAKELGCVNSNFTNPSGAHDENHYSSAYDLSLIGRYAMQNENFRELVRKTFYQLSATNKYPKDDRIFTTTNELLVSNSNNRSDNYYYKYATGIKTGFTTPAAYCLMASSEKEGLNFISVVLGAGQTIDGLSARYIDTKNLFDYGYSSYSLKQIAKKYSVIETVTISNATKDTKKLDLIIDDDISATVKAQSLNVLIKPEIEITADLKAPIAKNSIIGTVHYTVDGITYSANLLANNEVQSSHVVIKFIIVFIVIILIIGFIKINNNFKKKKRLAKIKNI